ncbi:MAG: hypothetical protein IJK40_02305 [Clostridia bacterium]|nr:hypothetical protein [Clostridia bacterium]
MIRVQDLNGAPALVLNGAPVPAVGYMTYLPPYNRYQRFAAAGYGLFFLPVFFAGRSISATPGVMPFGKGIFDRKGEPDFSVLDDVVERVLAVNKDAQIILRVNVSLPEWWLKENPESLDATGEHESLSSKTACLAAETLLLRFLSYVRQATYAGRVIGYHLAGANTEEWFHYDRDLPPCRAALDGFRQFLADRYPSDGTAAEPDLNALKKKGVQHCSVTLSRYLEYRSLCVVNYIITLARAVRRTVGREAAIGVFYGYDLEVSVPHFGTHGLSELIKSDAIDFICSPNSYIGCRDPEADWTEMYPAGSVRLHGKLCFQECDVRTHLTKLLSVSAPEYDPLGKLSAPVWQPVPDKREALFCIRKTFCRQLIAGNGLWWFDMWGGWYDDPDIMSEMAAYRRIYGDSLKKEDRSDVCEFAVFTDERMYFQMTDCGLRNAVYDQRRALGQLGAPYEIYDITDFEAVRSRFRAVMFLTGIETKGLKKARALCEREGIPYLYNAEEKPIFSPGELQAFCRRCGVHLYCETGDVVYVNKNYFAVSALTPGKKTFRFREPLILRGLTDPPVVLSGKTVSLQMARHETVLFEIGR